jgi:hypothetical protein
MTTVRSLTQPQQEQDDQQEDDHDKKKNKEMQNDKPRST